MMSNGKSLLTGKLTRRTVLRTMGTIGLGAAGLGLAGCTTTTTVPPTTTAPTTVPTTTPVTGGTFKFANQQFTNSMDPRYAEAFLVGYYAAPCFEPLLSIDLDWKVVGVLAEDFVQLSDTKYRFNLREGVKFHDGTDFTANDAKTNILFCAGLIPNQYKHRYIGFFNKITSADVIDSYTLDVNLSEPWAYAIASLPILNPTYIMKDADARSASQVAKPVGTGPYKINEYVEGSYTSYARFNDWWGKNLDDFWTGTQYFDTLTYKGVTDESARLVELQNGSVDCIYYQGNATHELVKADANLDYVMHPDMMCELQRFNLRKLPTSDKRFREAVFSAVDYEAVITTLQPKDHYLEDLYEGSVFEDAHLADYLPAYDPQHAKDLVNELKNSGISTTVDYIYVPAPATDARAGAIIGYMQQAGITVNLVATDNVGFRTNTVNGNFHMCEGLEMIPAANPWVFFFAQLHSKSGYSTVDSRNLSGINDPIMDTRINNMMKSTDPAVIHDDVVAVGQRVYQMNYMRPMYQENRVYAFNKKVQDFQGDGSFRRGFPIAGVWKSA